MSWKLLVCYTYMSCLYMYMYTHTYMYMFMWEGERSIIFWWFYKVSLPCSRCKLSQANFRKRRRWQSSPTLDPSPPRGRWPQASDDILRTFDCWSSNVRQGFFQSGNCSPNLDLLENCQLQARIYYKLLMKSVILR